MRYFVVLVLPAILVLPALAADPPAEDQKALYGLGLRLKKQLIQPQLLKPHETDPTSQRLSASPSAKPPKADPDLYGPKPRDLAQARIKVASEAEKKKGQEFLEKSAKDKGAKKT